jgi:histidine triad (HIT) family protein
MPDNCLFCKIVRGEIPATILVDTDDSMVFRDINPQAPFHVLVIPKRHIPSLNEADDAVQVGNLMRLAARVVADEGIAESGYRVVVNTNADGGQTVGHLHLHLLGGRHMTWPPG